MVKLTKRVVEAATTRTTDYILWDEELPCFGLRVFPSGRRSYLVQYRQRGRSRRLTIGSHGVWTAETARREAKAQLGRVATGNDPAEERIEDHQAMTVRQLCERYIRDLEDGLILGKGGRPKKQSTIDTDIGRIRRHVIPLIGSRRVKDLTRADMVKIMRDIMAGRSRIIVKTKKLRGKSIVKGGPGTATRTLGLIGGILTYAIDLGVIERNPAHGIKKPKYKVRERRLSEVEYGIFGRLLEEAKENGQFWPTTEIIRIIALTGCRRSEIINLKWCDVDFEGSCLRLSESKEGRSIRPIGLPVVELLEAQRELAIGSYVFPGYKDDTAFGGFPRQWKTMLDGTPLEGVTAHVLRHSFASIGNDLGYTEVTIAALLGHAKGSITSRYIHVLDATLITAADMISSYVGAMLDGARFQQAARALDRASRRKAMGEFLSDQDPRRMS
ncbi:tyrosine-type recombinase/integrase [Qipengyuania qiaonensis]|uniref:Tyrosine-type recombinase/integrase n=1 Tax=Qipengyuania qiaonensis TaxID=2867240 RepID=A0ABS7J631_9SPHN|nr:site-specific integrase [Qipengyuania qiaonensis]MBX7481726.1 tyrosine-type recombinase/integrase [Qipengyuania qiaonensis]